MQKLLLFSLLFSGCVEVPLYTKGESWVTEYLEKGGDLQNITGLVLPAGWEKNAVFDNITPQTSLPPSWDWQSVVQLQPIRNQGGCGSCWSFAISAMIESIYRLTRPMSMSPDFAEQTMVSSCCTSCGSCAGGYFTALNYARDKGLPGESQDPYTARNSSCKSGLTPEVKITRWAYVGSNPTTAQIKQAIYDHGPVTVDVNGSFGNYSSGIYNSCGSTGTNHMVTLLGWVDDPTLRTEAHARAYRRHHVADPRYDRGQGDQAARHCPRHFRDELRDRSQVPGSFPQAVGARSVPGTGLDPRRVNYQLFRRLQTRNSNPTLLREDGVFV